MAAGRKPVHLLAASKKPTGRQAIWQGIRAIREGFTIPELAARTDIHPDTVRTYLIGLAAAGFIVRIPSSIRGGWNLVKDVGVEAPRVTKGGQTVTQGLAREQMWRTMKLLPTGFGWRELAMVSSTDDVPVAEADARDYCRNLALAGYLAVVTKGKGSKATCYRFIKAKNTGPKPPQVQRMQTVFDPNLGQIVWHPEVDA